MGPSRKEEARDTFNLSQDDIIHFADAERFFALGGTSPSTALLDCFSSILNSDRHLASHWVVACILRMLQLTRTGGTALPQNGAIARVQPLNELVQQLWGAGVDSSPSSWLKRILPGVKSPVFGPASILILRTAVFCALDYRLDPNDELLKCGQSILQAFSTEYSCQETQYLQQLIQIAAAGLTPEDRHEKLIATTDLIELVDALRPLHTQTETLWSMAAAPPKILPSRLTLSGGPQGKTESIAVLESLWQVGNTGTGLPFALLYRVFHLLVHSHLYPLTADVTRHVRKLCTMLRYSSALSPLHLSTILTLLRTFLPLVDGIDEQFAAFVRACLGPFMGLPEPWHSPVTELLDQLAQEVACPTSLFVRRLLCTCPSLLPNALPASVAIDTAVVLSDSPSNSLNAAIHARWAPKRYTPRYSGDELLVRLLIHILWPRVQQTQADHVPLCVTTASAYAEVSPTEFRRDLTQLVQLLFSDSPQREQQFTELSHRVLEAINGATESRGINVASISSSESESPPDLCIPPLDPSLGVHCLQHQSTSERLPEEDELPICPGCSAQVLLPRFDGDHRLCRSCGRDVTELYSEISSDHSGLAPHSGLFSGPAVPLARNAAFELVCKLVDRTTASRLCILVVDCDSVLADVAAAVVRLQVLASRSFHPPLPEIQILPITASNTTALTLDPFFNTFTAPLLRFVGDGIPLGLPNIGAPLRRLESVISSAQSINAPMGLLMTNITDRLSAMDEDLRFREPAMGSEPHALSSRPSSVAPGCSAAQSIASAIERSQKTETFPFSYLQTFALWVPSLTFQAAGVRQHLACGYAALYDDAGSFNIVPFCGHVSISRPGTQIPSNTGLRVARVEVPLGVQMPVPAAPTRGQNLTEYMTPGSVYVNEFYTDFSDCRVSILRTHYQELLEVSVTGTVGQPRSQAQTQEQHECPHGSFTYVVSAAEFSIAPLDLQTPPRTGRQRSFTVVGLFDETVPKQQLLPFIVDIDGTAFTNILRARFSWNGGKGVPDSVPLLTLGVYD